MFAAQTLRTKRQYFRAALVIPLVSMFLPVVLASRAEAVTENFTTSGETAWVVPAGVTSVDVKLIGQRGANGGSGGGQGGMGAEVNGTLTVSAGQTLYVVVGGAGWNGIGTNGGGNGGYGGGASDVRTLSCASDCNETMSRASRLMVAGGGGGGGGSSNGPGAGGTAGQNPTGGGSGFGFVSAGGGAAGSVNAPGAGGSSPSLDGQAGSGGKGGNGTPGTNNVGGGGGGGGGYYGGGGGGGSTSGGGGGGGGAGSSYVGNAQNAVISTAVAADPSVTLVYTVSLTAPATMTAPVATAGTEQASVAFNAPSDGGSTITNYTVTSSPGNITASGTSSPIVVTGLTNGVGYTFTITATNNIGTSSPSPASNEVTPIEPPGIPGTPVATRGNTQASVAFSSPTTGGPPVSYTVTSSPGGLTGSGSSSPIIVTGLTNGTEYTFTVTATNVMGTSSPSAASNAVTPATHPGVPTNLIGTPGDQQVSVAFQGPSIDGGSSVTSYTVTASPGGATASGASSPIVVAGLTNGTEYTFTVTATNSAGTSSASSQSSAVIPAGPPLAPTNASAVRGNGQATVSFGAPDTNGRPITSYTVTASPGGATGTGSSSPVVVTGLNNGTSYTFTVTATNSVGTGSASSPSNSVTPATLPGSPTAPVGTSGNGQVSVAFQAPSSNGGSAVTSYTVTASPGGATATGASSPIVVSGLENGTEYTFSVTATNDVGTSSSSASSPAVTPADVPGAPTTVTVVDGIGEVTVSFFAPTSTGGSPITSYTVTSSPGGVTATGTSSPIVVTGLTNGITYTFTVRANNSAGPSLPSEVSAAVTPRSPTSPGITAPIHLASDGTVTEVPVFQTPNPAAQVTASTPSGEGSWTLAPDGGVFTAGDAGFFGSLGGAPLNAPAVGIAPTPTADGYYIIASDGGVFAFGDAKFEGSMGGTPLNAPVTGIAPTCTANGYYLVADDGGVFAFGDAGFFGSMAGQPLNAGMLGIVDACGRNGYWTFARDGGVFTYGDAQFFGSLGSNPPAGGVIGMVSAPDGLGYWLIGADRKAYGFGSVAN